ncbi:PcfJ domain-containing protein [Rhizobium sp. BK176]|uniref:PcfJ domain-containing protein n=1 Tax=Rhizobium sp. BK176 TaxID=2587071 RepID=UPI00216A4348|nr:PcfJ domain-containing protein [Rhizobium sp. BK176]MCS4089727.1 hypothetical protein [Rhizobium sp. BK176]
MRRPNRKYSVIGAFIGVLSTDSGVLKLLAYSVGRVLYNTQPDDYNPTEHPEHQEAGRHIADWLTAAVANREHWLSNVDELGRPKKLLKFPTMEAIVKEADKAMLRYIQKTREVALRNGDEEMVMTLDDGFHVVRLLTPAALDRESKEMQHCIGNGAYDDRLHDRRFQYLSLRDRNGKAHATLEVEGGRVIQLQGKQNRQPNREYLEAIAPLLRREEYLVQTDRTDLRYVYADDYKVVDAWDLTGCSEVIGDLRRSRAALKMPEKLRVRGEIDLSHCSFPEGFPSEVEADGSISIKECRPFTAPARIVSGGDLTIYDVLMEGDIAHCEAGGSVSFRKTSMDKLPRYLRFHGSLDLGKTGIESLAGLGYVAGSLSLEGARIESLPENIRIGGKLDASSSRLKEYPRTAKIGGDVDISYTQVAFLPPVTVKGKLNISSTKITVVPGGLVTHSLHATGLAMEHFGPKSIRGDLDLAYSSATLPHGLTVGGFLTLDNGSFGNLPDNLRAARIKANSAEVTSIGRGLVVEGNLAISGNPITTLPADMDVWGDIVAGQTLIETLPDGFECAGDLNLTDSCVTALPYGLRVGGSLCLHHNEIAELPENLVVGSDLTITCTDIRSIPECAEIGNRVRSDIPEIDSGWSKYNEVRHWRAQQAAAATMAVSP